MVNVESIKPWVSPVGGFFISLFASLLYGFKAIWGETTAWIGLMLLMMGVSALATFMNSVQLTGRNRFVTLSMISYLSVLFMWLFMGLLHKEVTWIGEWGSLIVGIVYAAWGSSFLFSSKLTWLWQAFGVAVLIVFVFPLTDASPYSNKAEVMLLHWASFAVIFYLRLFHDVFFKPAANNETVIHTILSTIWLLDVPLRLCPYVYVFVAIYESWQIYSEFTETPEADEEKNDIEKMKPAAPVPPPVKQPPKRLDWSQKRHTSTTKDTFQFVP